MYEIYFLSAKNLSIRALHDICKSLREEQGV